ncbi:uncharacterized protein DNG_09255 [Cephalotrichum gorgonifer]|uniref:DUF7357 domain-containing protein n=1 Tax=Cephalotrichum gorgonifer TaxID=2041049 RepID=A0AAE8N837_9PEZI|nr:uncharacterized protein DNG_09255 [Cephalotrichum gorgonifer]
MRLRLTVRRSGVPEVKLMWNADADADSTISRLLSGVNEVVPLESGEWGLEDYAVEYKDEKDEGFECLHFQVVRDILKEDDPVLIRPLFENDIRRRRLSGRHQISADGKHLVDGVAFGRPRLRAPVNRPTIELPPRKRARISYGSSDDDEDADWSSSGKGVSHDEDSDASEEEEQLLLEGVPDDGADEDDSSASEGDDDIVREGEVVGGSSDDGEGYLTPGPETAAGVASPSPVPSLHSSVASPPLPAYPSAMEVSPDTRPQTLSSILSKLGKLPRASTKKVEGNVAARSEPDKSSSESSDDSDSDSDSDSSSSENSSSSDSDSDSDSSSDSGEDAGAALTSPSLPNAGGRDESDSDSSSSAPSEEDTKGPASRPAADSAGSSSSSDSDLTAIATENSPLSDELLERRQALLKSLETDGSPAVTPRKRKAQGDGAGPASPTVQNGTTAPIPDDHDEVMDESPDAWKDKIIYTAVECAREGVTLSEPPFPFVQRWDPQQKADVWFGNSKRGGKGKRKLRDQAHYYEDDTGHAGKKRKVSPWPEALAYDEYADVNMNGNGAEDAEVDGADGASDGAYHTPDDLPSLPKDINSLPVLTLGEVAPGMVITWKQFLLSKATRWQPQFGSVTGVVVSLDGDVMNVLLAKRDRVEKTYDPETGERIYEGFEAPDEDGGEGEDDGSRQISFKEISDPRVVQGPPAAFTPELLAGFGNGFSVALPGDDSAPIPESLPVLQDGQGGDSFEAFSMDLQVPMVNGDSEASQAEPADPAATNGLKAPQVTSLEPPSAISSVASGRRQPDPNSLPVSLELEVTMPDSVPQSSAEAPARAADDTSLMNRAERVLREVGVVDPGSRPQSLSPPPSEALNAPEVIKLPGSPRSYFAAGDEYLPKKLRGRNGNGNRKGSENGKGSRSDSEDGGIVKVEREASRGRRGLSEERAVGHKRADSPPRLVFPGSSPPRFGSQGQRQGLRSGARGRTRSRSSPFELPAGSQVVDLLSDGDGEEIRLGTPISGQKDQETPVSNRRSQSQSQSQKGTPVGQKGRKGRGGKATPGSQKRKGRGQGMSQTGVV